jgi:hypothetical protein
LFLQLNDPQNKESYCSDYKKLLFTVHCSKSLFIVSIIKLDAATHNTHHSQHRFGFTAAKAAPPPVSSSTPITAIDCKPTPSYCLQQPAAPQPP